VTVVQSLEKLRIALSIYRNRQFQFYCVLCWTGAFTILPIQNKSLLNIAKCYSDFFTHYFGFIVTNLGRMCRKNYQFQDGSHGPFLLSKTLSMSTRFVYLASVSLYDSNVCYFLELLLDIYILINL
jgi:hypothetical protein